MDSISIRGAKVHNLKNIDVSLPRNKLVVITGLSGSGKSSLAFDTIYAEGQRRYVESLSAYARQFLSLMEKPDVDHIEGLSPAISIEQKATSHNPRSTVGTITEIYDYLRLLFARVGSPRCPDHGVDLQAQTISQMVDSILVLPEDSKIMVMAPIVRNRKGSHQKLLQELSHEGFLRARIDGIVQFLEEVEELDGNKNHTIEIVIDRLKVRQDISSRLSESLQTALNMSFGVAIVSPMDVNDEWEELTFSAKFSCVHCGYSLDELEPRLFSFNNPVGACEVCDGLGVKDVFDEQRVVANPELSLEDGAVYGWSKNNAYFYQMLTLVGNFYNFSVSTPFKELSDEHKKIILYGSGSQSIDFSKIKGRRGWSSRKKPFEGIIPRMVRRYADSDIRSVREDLSRYVISKPCASCQGDRLNAAARNVFINNNNISDLTKLTIDQVYEFFKYLELEGQRGEIASKILNEISQRLHFLINVGLDYLNLERKANSLSGGEAQRIRLASQIGAGLIGVLYVLDEPSIGLHQRDNQKLLDTLTYLRDLGNTVIVVEHDEEAIRQADYVIDVGAGNGYFSLRIALEGAKKVLGIEPFLLFNYQYAAIDTLIKQNLNSILLPLRLEEMPTMPVFESVFSMGVLYHQRNHMEHLSMLKSMMAPKSELILETLIVEGPKNYSLIPKERYANMRNVYCLPSIETLKSWLIDAGYKNINVIDISKTTPKEQRKTKWIGENPASLEDFLDSFDSTLTVEGYPAPTRAIIICNN